MSAPNLFLVYVTDTQASTDFYRDLFEIEPVFVHPAYVAFETAPGILFSLWSRHSRGELAGVPRTSEVGLMLPSTAGIDALYETWAAKGVTVVEEPRDEVFGRTFVIADPDGNLIRVCPVD